MRRLILSAEAARDRGSKDTPATGRRMARIHGPAALCYLRQAGHSGRQRHLIPSGAPTPAAMRGIWCMAGLSEIRAELADLGALQPEYERPVMPM